MFAQQLVNGLTLGGVYALVALGYTMVYGILELINFAHGEIYMLGAYIGILSLAVFTVWGWTQSAPLLSMVAAVALAVMYCGVVGATMERVAYRPLRRAHRLTPLISAIGVSILLQNVVMLTQGSSDRVFPAFADLERVAYRPLRRAHRLTPLISAIGVSILLQNGVMLTQGSSDRVFPAFADPPATYTVGGATITGLQLAIIGISAGLMVGLIGRAHV